MIFIWIKGRRVCAKGATYHFRVLFVIAFIAMPYVFPLYSWTQWHGVSLYLRGFRVGLVNRDGMLDSCNCPLYFPLYVCTRRPWVLGFLFVRVFYLDYAYLIK